MFCRNMMRIALELSAEDPAFLGLATKFFEHYAYIGAAMNRMGGGNCELWSQRPVHNQWKQYEQGPHWRELVLFFEYFHGDTGAGLGASHQTGWTGLVATLVDEWRH
jgi:hypothetical protein